MFTQKLLLQKYKEKIFRFKNLKIQASVNYGFFSTFICKLQQFY